jgi:hypothetical protein
MKKKVLFSIIGGLLVLACEGTFNLPQVTASKDDPDGSGILDSAGKGGTNGTGGTNTVDASGGTTNDSPCTGIGVRSNDGTNTVDPCAETAGQGGQSTDIPDASGGEPQVAEGGMGGTSDEVPTLMAGNGGTGCVPGSTDDLGQPLVLSSNGSCVPQKAGEGGKAGTTGIGGMAGSPDVPDIGGMGGIAGTAGSSAGAGGTPPVCTCSQPTDGTFKLLVYDAPDDSIITIQFYDTSTLFDSCPFYASGHTVDPLDGVEKSHFACWEPSISRSMALSYDFFVDGVSVANNEELARSYLFNYPYFNWIVGTVDETDGTRLIDEVLTRECPTGPGSCYFHLPARV